MRFIFLMTHLGSGSSCLSESLSYCTNVRSTQTNKVYLRPTKDLDFLKDQYRHNKTYIDTILFNHHLINPVFIEKMEFMFFIRNPRESILEIMDKGYSAKGAMNYYLFRLRRMYEIAYKKPGSLFLTSEDLNRGGEKLISDYLGVRVPKIHLPETRSSEQIPQYGYDKYVAKFRRLNLKML